MNNKVLTVAITSRSLFDLEESHEIFTKQGIDAYNEHQIKNEDTILKPGGAFSLVKKLLDINKYNKNNELSTKVILISRNNANIGPRIFKSIYHYNLDIENAAFTSGSDPWLYIKPFNADLFLSNNPQSVKEAIENGIAAATIIPHGNIINDVDNNNDNDNSKVDFNHKDISLNSKHLLKIAFDGDAVLFSDEAEKVFRKDGIEGFKKHEAKHSNKLLPKGPFSKFLEMIHQIQNNFEFNKSPIRTALVTARSAPAHERAIRTLRNWNINVDEAFFLGDYDKTPFLKAFKADIFFDDKKHHCELATQDVDTTTTAAHVPYGISNNGDYD